MQKQTLFLALMSLFLGSTLLAQTYEIDTENSQMEWIGKKVTGSHNGLISFNSGTLEFEDDQLVGGTFEADMTSIDVTDLEGNMKSKLEGHLNSDDFFGVADHPTSSLSITNVEKNEAGETIITAQLSIKGIEEEISFPAQVEMKDGKVMASAELKVDRTKYNIRYGSGSFFDNLGDKTIYDEFSLKVNLVTK